MHGCRARRLAVVATARAVREQQAFNAGRAAAMGAAQSQAAPAVQQAPVQPAPASYLHTSAPASRAEPAMEPVVSESHKAALRNVKPKV